MKAIRILSVFMLLLASGCSLFSSKLVRNSSRVIVMTEGATAYAMNDDATVGPAIGTLAAHAGDTIAALGTLAGGFMEPTWHVVLREGREVYVKDGDLLTEDEHLWRRTASSFRLNRNEDPTAWGRAVTYIIHHAGSRIQISSNNLIQTEAPVDSAAIGYLVTRVPSREWVEYQITCSSKQKGFDSVRVARKLAFFMTTGRKY